jgi:glutamine amidotransferase
MAPRVAVIDYGIGNMHSIHKALVRVGADARLATNQQTVESAEAVVLPGVGAFGACLDALEATGLREVTIEAARSGQPFLGVCVGMQMLFDRSEESPGAVGLGVIPGAVRSLGADVRHPQMQWNRVEMASVDGGMDAIFGGLALPLWMYFVHSFAAVPADRSEVIATCEYGGPVTAAVRSGSLVAVQFHPEKSSTSGLGLLANFVRSVGNR